MNLTSLTHFLDLDFFRVGEIRTRFLLGGGPRRGHWNRPNISYMVRLQRTPEKSLIE